MTISFSIHVAIWALGLVIFTAAPFVLLITSICSKQKDKEQNNSTVLMLCLGIGLMVVSDHFISEARFKQIVNSQQVQKTEITQQAP